jgi:ornithine carbamoyltransferase
MARVFEHDHILQLAQHSSVPIINGLSDYNHPAQGLADLFTILEVKGKLQGLKVAYVGDGNNVARSLLFGAMKTGMSFAIASPDGYTLTGDDRQKALAMRANSNQTVTFVADPAAAVRGADVVYTDVWTSMGQEEESARRLQVFPPYQVNEALVAQAKDDCMVMHCLPAHRGEEITDAVADGPHSVLFQQAENRMHAQKAILVRLLA